MTTTAPSTPAAPRAAGAAPAARRVLAQTAFEARAVLRNGEQLLVTLVVPVLLLVGLTRSSFVEIGTGGAARVDVLAPSVLALAVMTTSFTSQAIATAFDRRNGVLRLLATTPLGRPGLLLGKAGGVLVVEAVQLLVIGATALALGWRPAAAGILPALLAAVLGTVAFVALALLVAGTLRAEAVLAVANLLLLLLALAGGVVVPLADLPPGLAAIAAWLPSGALGEAMRVALVEGRVAVAPLAVLAGWAALLVAAAARLFRWS
ncbi:ABC transporter permease [Cellulomonas marina]|uniref:Transport permease protein n=1 Tax=Cellulomonas marina TaxID=988821 RepID=A0A1I0ZUC0_9CELL|nr:ABC transporter permease [Cellulomonas marina]GIG28785.1 ABC transporter [Cellulomonas marina]SFB28676.1 ABC-2 type transport system permease protein [Cellulomonas marina]